MDTQLNHKELFIVTGAAGNLGSAIVRNLVAGGKSVRSFVLRGEEAAKHLPEGANVYEGDVTDVSSLDTLFSDIPADTTVYCIHCAAMVSVSNLVADRIWHVNVDGTQNIINQCREHKARLIFIGSTGAIPEEPKGTVIREVDHFDPNAVIGIYDQTKAASCQLVLDAIHNQEIDGCIILPSGISGPGDYTFGNVAGVIREYVEGKMPAGVEGTFNCADNRDMAETIIRACREGRSGESYILGGDQIGMKEVFDILAEHTGLPTIKTILPAGMGKFLGSMSDMAEMMTHKPQRMTSFAVYNLVRNNEFDSSKAMKELGYSPRPMAQSVAEEIDWMLSEGIVSLPKSREADTRSLGEKLSETGSAIGHGIAAGYKAVEHGVVSGYKAVEHGVVTGYNAVEDGITDGVHAVGESIREMTMLRAGASFTDTTGIRTGEADEGKVCSSYTNTEELDKKFPVEHPTAVNPGMESAIRNRLLNGFENWNRGFDVWKAWGDILYTQDSMYNVHGVRLTLPEYQKAMNLTLCKNDIRMGKFRNMIINDDWAAIHYDISTINRETGEEKDGSVMEFVQFENYGDGMDTRVVEGWAGTKGEDYENLMQLLTPEEREAQMQARAEILAREIPEIDVLAVRYPVLHPTSVRTAKGREIRQAILLDFDCWNKGFDEWETWAKRTLSEDFVCHTDYGDASREQYLENARIWFDEKKSKRLYFDNLLVRDDWAAIHYRIVYTENGIKEDKSMMQFFRFREEDDGVRLVECWNK
ncbi:MAG: NAD-dependent epimerase/dehydratase family protein [Oscillospiraceae bacterium]|nr:NAD-dependent epimerase/dehydratase family protein [Oscillospiraceae bacterium]